MERNPEKGENPKKGYKIKTKKAKSEKRDDHGRVA
jgi:hypothetical protein